MAPAPARRRQRTAAAAAALLAACALLLPGGACGLEYLQDETLWMKQRWGEWRLPFPWALVKRRDAEATRQLQGPLAGWEGNSMNGPLLDGAVLAAKAEEAGRKAAGGGGGTSLDLSLLDSEASQEVAAAVASCKVRGLRTAGRCAAACKRSAAGHQSCQVRRAAPACVAPLVPYALAAAPAPPALQVCGSLTKQLWGGLTAWVDRHRLLPSDKALAAYASELCEYEVRKVPCLLCCAALRCAVPCRRGCAPRARKTPYFQACVEAG